MDNQQRLQKNFYREAESVTKRSQQDVDKYMRDNFITTHGDNIPRPVTSFDESSLPKYLVDQLKAEFDKPSVIQS
jgi:ATP-dependent RNA helicase DDX5/DBP2